MPFVSIPAYLTRFVIRPLQVTEAFTGLTTFGSTFQPTGHVVAQGGCSLHDWVDISAGADVTLPEFSQTATTFEGVLQPTGHATAPGNHRLYGWVGIPASDNFFAPPESLWVGSMPLPGYQGMHSVDEFGDDFGRV